MTRYARVILLAGPSGSGKSYIARRTGLPVLVLDDFYKNGDDPTLPRLGGAVDWESPLSWDARHAVDTIERLCREGRAEVPVYALGEDRRVATSTLDLDGHPIFVAEGIFAADIIAECRDRGLLAAAYALHRPRLATLVRRLVRDLSERRKPPGLLVRRSLALFRDEPRILLRHTTLGALPASAHRILQAVATHLAAPSAAGPPDAAAPELGTGTPEAGTAAPTSPAH